MTTDIWKHGKYIDTWSLVHFLSGVILASATWYVGLSLAWSFLVSLALLLIWELFEAIKKIIEPSVNVAVDIGVGLLGFFLGAYFHFYTANPFGQITLAILVGVTLLLSFWGFMDFLKKGYR
jgi:hypothetical protein